MLGPAGPNMAEKVVPEAPAVIAVADVAATVGMASSKEFDGDMKIVVDSATSFGSKTPFI